MSRFTEFAARRAVRAAAVVVAVGATVALVPVTQASADTAIPDSGCTPNIGLTHKSGSYIVGYGNLGACNGEVTMTIQRSRWWGWEDLKSGTINSRSDQYVSYNCAGTGTHDFRAIETWWGLDGNEHVRSSNTITATC